MFVRYFFFIFLAMSVLGTPSSVRAMDVNEGYAVPTFRELSQTLTILGGLDAMKDDVFDEYAQIMYCDLYKDKYLNDFEWSKIRSKIRSRVQEKKDYYRVLYEVTAPVILGRYDFERQVFPLVDRSALDNVGVIVIYDDSQFRYACGETQQFLKLFPRVYYLSLDRPVTITGMPISADEAKNMLDVLESVKITTNVSSGDTAMARKAYLRFRFRIGGAIDASNLQRALFRGAIEQVDFFVDQEATKFIVNIPVRKRRLLD